MSMRTVDFLGDYINGEFILDLTSAPFHSMNPASLNDVICPARSREGSVDQAVTTATKALIEWRRMGFDGRVEALRRVAGLVEQHRDRIAEAITAEMGKPIKEARIEAGSIKSKIEGTIAQWAYTLPQAPPNAPGEQRFHPLGVVGIVGPFNFPIHLLNTHIIPALLAGNTVIIKPSEVTPLCGQRYMELFHEAHFPIGVLNMVQGRGDVGAALVAHEDLNGVIFTGSYETGRKIRQATFDQPHKKICLELGGKNPAVVLDDADLDQACREILLGALLTSGQRCTATSRVIATAQIAESLKHRLIDAFKRIKPLDPTREDAFMGPLANHQAQERFMHLLIQAKEEGAEPWVESVASSGGAFVTPSIYGVSGDEGYLEHELFGPHIAFQTVANEEEAYAWASQNRYGLSASIFTAREEAFEAFYERVPTGVLNWNRSTNGASGLLPFGGVGKSGNWHPAGSEGPRLSTYPVAVMSVPYGQLTSNPALEAQLHRDPIKRLERQHRLEEVGERFGLWLEVEGLSLRLSASALRVRDGGVFLSPDALRAQALLHGLNSDERGVFFDLESVEPIEGEEERLIRYLESLLTLDPMRFLFKPKREIQSPKGGSMPRSSQWLERFYGGSFVPREKKPAVIDLARSQGPFLRSIDDQPLQIIDAASQIASLPAGFRPDRAQKDLDEGRFDPYLTYAPHPEELGGDAFKELESHLLEYAPTTTPYVCWTNGGAEANEKAFHLARTHGPGGHRIIAFESAFHGRTLLSLYCTWNPIKRAPYQIKGHEAVFLSRPIPEDPYLDPDIPTDWYSSWATPHVDRESLKGSGDDALLSQEVDALCALEKELIAGDVLGCIIEPYQCEGGDVTPTRRFFHGLRALTRAYDVPLIFDEVQSGFGLSGSIFWHERLGLVDAEGKAEGPDLVTGAKRAQVGFVLSHWPDPNPGPAHAASAVRGAAHLNLLEELPSHESLLRSCLADLVKRWSRIILRPRAFGDAFAFDLPTAEIASHMIGQRFYQGYMVYIAGKKTLRYRMNRSFTPKEIQAVFRVIERSLEMLTQQAGGPGDDLIERMSACTPPLWRNRNEPDADYTLTLTEVLTVPGDADVYLRQYGELSRARRAAGEAALELSATVSDTDIEVLSKADPTAFERAAGYTLTHFVADRIGIRIRRVSLAEFDSMADQVRALEENSYEPARRDEFETLRGIAIHPEGIAIFAEDPEGLVGMSFASPLEEWPHIQGPDEDALFNQKNTLYGADTSVDIRGRGHGVGQRLRAELIKIALKARRPDGKSRYSFISGRNRVGGANAMWAINQRWGAYLVKMYGHQYGEDEGQSRYYRLPLRRYDRRGLTPPEPIKHQAWGVHQPTGAQHELLSHARDLGVFDEGALTKLTVSNFITPAYARYAEALRAICPPGCAHMYYTSCLDEMVDKSIRSLKHNRKDGEVVLSFTGAHFGVNTAAGRSLGGDESDRHFQWPAVPHPSQGLEQCLIALDTEVERAGGPDGVIALFVESIQSHTGVLLTDEAWHALCEWRERTQIPIVFSEVTTGMGRSGRGFWWLDQAQGEADIVLWWAGGQIGHIFARPHVFVSKPLTLISTWDGDELSATRLLWQLYALSEVDLSDLARWLDHTLTTHFDADTLGGFGLYRVVQHPRSQELYTQLKERGVQVQRVPKGLCFAPPLTLSVDERSTFESTLIESLNAMS